MKTLVLLLLMLSVLSAKPQTDSALTHLNKAISFLQEPPKPDPIADQKEAGELLQRAGRSMTAAAVIPGVITVVGVYISTVNPKYGAITYLLSGITAAVLYTNGAILMREAGEKLSEVKPCK